LIKIYFFILSRTFYRRFADFLTAEKARKLPSAVKWLNHPLQRPSPEESQFDRLGPILLIWSGLIGGLEVIPFSQ